MFFLSDSIIIIYTLYIDNIYRCFLYKLQCILSSWNAMVLLWSTMIRCQFKSIFLSTLGPCNFGLQQCIDHWESALNAAVKEQGTCKWRHDQTHAYTWNLHCLCEKLIKVMFSTRGMDWKATHFNIWLNTYHPKNTIHIWLGF